MLGPRTMASEQRWWSTTWTAQKACATRNAREKASPAMLRHGMVPRRRKKPDIAAAAAAAVAREENSEEEASRVPWEHPDGQIRKAADFSWAYAFLGPRKDMLGFKPWAGTQACPNLPK